jgi:hypothetical protein
MVRIYIIGGILALAGILYFGFWGQDAKKAAPADDKLAETQTAIFNGFDTSKSVKGTYPEVVKQTFKGLHDEFNDLAGYGGISKFLDRNSEKWSQFEKFKPGQSYEELRKAVKNPELEQDLKNLEALIDYAKQEHDSQALRYAHRIAHDLDYWVFNWKREREDDYWGVTHVLEGKKENTVDRFLKDKAK